MVGTSTTRTPRSHVAATNPARSVTAPPPTPTIASVRPTPAAASWDHSPAATLISLAASPSGTGSGCTAYPAWASAWQTGAATPGKAAEWMTTTFLA